MDKRQQQLQELKSYTEGIDKELTMILQTLQWDRKEMLQSPVLVTCRYDSNHKVPPDKAEEHEKDCFLRQNGYYKNDQLLPDPLDLESDTLVKLKKEDIVQIIANASRADPLFKRGVGCREAEPMSLERLQTSYSADERRAIHDAVVNAVPSCHDLTDLALLSGGHEKSSKVILSRQEILAELRNMRRRRTKYRVAAKSCNYSDVLRDVIKTQMEHYNDGKSETEKNVTVDRDNSQRYDDRRHTRPMSIDNEKERYRYDGKIVPRPIKIKTEREDIDYTEKNYKPTQRDCGRERSDRYEKGSRERYDRDNDRREHYDRSRDRRGYEDMTQKYGAYSRNRRYDDEHREKRYSYEDSKGKRKDDDRDREHRTDKRSRKDHRHKDYNPEHQVKTEPGLEKESTNHQEGSSQDRRHDEKKDRTHKHKEKKDRRRERSMEKNRDNRYEERPTERIHIKQEKADRHLTRDDTNNYEKEKTDRKGKSKSKKRDKSYREGSYDKYSIEKKQEKFGEYSGGRPEEIYDPNKKIKEEK